MASDKIAAWLARQRRQGITLSSISCALAFVAGFAVLALMFAFLWFVFSSFAYYIFPNSGVAWAVSTVFTAVVIGLFTLDSQIAERDDMHNLPLWLLRECYSFGPRLIRDSIHHARRARGLRQLNVASCAVAISILASRKKSFALTELLQSCHGMSLGGLKRQLGLIEGVLLLRPDKSYALLSEPLRLLLSPLIREQQQQARHSARPGPEPETETMAQEPEALSAHEILGVSAQASLAEIKTAYRNRMKECHPDRFATLDETARHHAEEWAKAINAAYTALTTDNARPARSRRA